MASFCPHRTGGTRSFRAGSDIFEIGPPVELGGGFDGNSGVTHEQPHAGDIPEATKLFPMQPNLFTGTTTIRFYLATEDHVTLHIYDARGELVRSFEDGVLPSGGRRVIWDGRDASGKRVAAGVYFTRFSAGPFKTTEKVMLLQ